jgi:hypothetical protein
MFTTSNKRTKKKIRLIKTNKYKEKSEGLKMIYGSINKINEKKRRLEEKNAIKMD